MEDLGNFVTLSTVHPGVHTPRPDRNKKDKRASDPVAELDVSTSSSHKSYVPRVPPAVEGAHVGGRQGLVVDKELTNLLLVRSCYG